MQNYPLYPNSPIFHTGCEAKSEALQSMAFYTAERSGLQQKASLGNPLTFVIASNWELFNNFNYLKKKKKQKNVWMLKKRKINRFDNTL